MSKFYQVKACFLFPFFLLLMNSGAYAQCNTTSFTYGYPFITTATCNATGFTMDAYVALGEYFTPPYTNLSVMNLSGGAVPAVSSSRDTIFLTGMIYKNADNPNINLMLYLEDSCGRRDTTRILYSSFLNQYAANQSAYSYCDSSLRSAFVPRIAGGKTDFEVQQFSFTTWNYEPVTADLSETTADSLIIKGIYPEPYGAPLSLKILYKDDCGNTYTLQLENNLSNYNYNNATGGKYVCNATGLQQAVAHPALKPPFTLLDYKIDYPAYASSPVPAVVAAGDSIIFNNLLPYQNYIFRFLDGCNDTFRVWYEFGDDDTTLGYQPVFLGKACGTGHSIAIKTTGAGPFYDPVVEHSSNEDEADITLTSVYYTDSLVISGFPNKKGTYNISFRDSACHNRKYAFYEAYQDFIETGDNSAYERVEDSCNGNGFTIYGVLPGKAPFTGFNLIEGPSMPDIAYRGDTIIISKVVTSVTPDYIPLYRFSVTDACGKTDTFTILDVTYYLDMYMDKIHESGGCSGTENAAVTLKPVAGTWNEIQMPMPFFNPAITGPGTPSVVMDGNLIRVADMKPASDYVISFQDSCGHKYQYNYNSLPENSPVSVTLSTKLTGTCVNTMLLDNNYAIEAIIGGINYPYDAYLISSGTDTIAMPNQARDTLLFDNLTVGNYSLVTKDACNNINTQLYTIAPVPAFEKYGYAYFERFKGCDSIQYSYIQLFNYSSSVTENNIKFKGPYTAFVVRGTDTITSYNPDTTAVAIADKLFFNFPAKANYSGGEMMYVVDGCGDTITTYVQYYSYYSSSSACDGGVLTTHNTIRFDNIAMHYNFPLRLVYQYGNYDTATIVIANADDTATLDLGVGESAAYWLVDSCGTNLQMLNFYGPYDLHHVSGTRLCAGPGIGKNKGSVYIQPQYVTQDADIRYTYISGPQVVFTDTIIRLGYTIQLNDIDTGTYVFAAMEVNSCGQRDTFTVRVEPVLDSLSYTFIPGCLNANTLEIHYYTNQYTYHPDYHVMGLSGGYLNLRTLNGINIFSGQLPANNMIYNLPSGVAMLVTIGCYTDTIVSPAYNYPTIAASAAFGCGAGYSLSILGTKGTAPYQYEILSATPVNYTAPLQSGNTFTGLPSVSGNRYTVRLFDACGNAFTTQVKADSIANPLFESGFACIGSDYTGTVDSIPGMTYQWTYPNATVHNGRTISLHPVTMSDTGSYTLTLTNSLTGCVSTAVHTVRLVKCSVGIAATTANILCNGGTGSIDATGFGGTPPYTYSWSNGATTQDLTNVTAGTYKVIITDAILEKDSTEVTITQPDAITVSSSVNNIVCGGPNDGAIDLAIGGGVQPYEISWSNGAFTEDIMNLGAGTYTVNIADSNRCTYIQSYVVKPGNCLPVAVDDAKTTPKNKPIVNATVINNDTESGDGGNTWSLPENNGGAAHGTVTMGSNGTYTYTPTLDYVGTDEFTYILCDANGDCDTAVVTITIRQPLPVNLLKFEGIALQDCSVQLLWETGNEVSFDHFEIEAATDNKDYQQAGKVAAKGSGSKYAFKYNRTTEGKNYFRLKLNDVNGSSQYSKVLSVNVQCSGKRNIAVYPTVTEDNVQITGIRSGDKITLYDGTGKLVTEKTAIADMEELQLRSYPAGVYYLVISANNGDKHEFKVIRK